MTDRLERSTETFTYEGRTITGRALTLNRSYNLGSFTEEYASTAFERTLAHNPRKPLLVNHNRSMLPVGTTTFHVNGSELVYEAQIARGESGDHLLELIEMGALTGVSIGGVPLMQDVKRNGHIVRTQVALKELSLTGFPALDDAEITAIRSEQDAQQAKDFARILAYYRQAA